MKLLVKYLFKEIEKEPLLMEYYTSTPETDIKVLEFKYTYYLCQ